jgi:hypothetical protein
MPRRKRRGLSKGTSNFWTVLSDSPSFCRKPGADPYQVFEYLFLAPSLYLAGQTLRWSGNWWYPVSAAEP